MDSEGLLNGGKLDEVDDFDDDKEESSEAGAESCFAFNILQHRWIGHMRSLLLRVLALIQL